MTVTQRTVARPEPPTGPIPLPPRGDHAVGEPPRWFRPGFAVLLVATGVLYLWNLGANGYANTFYAAAVQASTRNPVAWLFAAVDAPGFITVDKPPADNWWMGLWANLFGFSSWSMLIPQAVLGIASVALLVLTVRRWSGPGVALCRGRLLALTPVAVIMFRFDDPDPMLTFLLVAAAYALVRAVDAAARRAGTAWLAVCGLLIGLGFLAKMGVALLVVPAFALVHLLAAGVSWPRRIGQLVAGLAGIVVGRGLVPGARRAVASLLAAVDRGLDRQLAAATRRGLQRPVTHPGPRLLARRVRGGDRGAARTGGRWPGWARRARWIRRWRRFRGAAGPAAACSPPEFGGQIAWLLPAALLGVRRAGVGHPPGTGTDLLRASTLLWGGWLVVASIVFSFMAGTVHTYYTVVMAPPLAAMVALGAREGWRRRETPTARMLPAVAVAGTAIWAAVMLSCTPTFVPWLPGRCSPRASCRAPGAAAPCPSAPRAGRDRPGRRITRRGGRPDGLRRRHRGLLPRWQRGLGRTTDPGRIRRRVPGSRGGPAGRIAGTPGAGQTTRGAVAAARGAGATGGRFGRDTQADPALDALLQRAGTTWSAAVPSTMAAAGLELSSNTSVMGLGGFSGSDPTPTLTQFQAEVAAGRIHYFLAGAQGAGPGGGRFAGFRGSPTSPTAAITPWVQSHFKAATVGGETVYDLTAPSA